LPDVIKIDVEGFEPQVLAGLEQIIGTKRPVIFFEHGLLSEKAVKQLVPAGYNLLFIGRDGSITAGDCARRESDDAILVPNEQAAALSGWKWPCGQANDAARR
jgi:hypothetical protein